MAWLIKSQLAAGNPVLDLEALKLQAVLEAERNTAVSNNSSLQQQNENLQQQLRDISNESSAKDARLEAQILNVRQERQNFQQIDQRLQEATGTINHLDKQNSYLNAELKYKNEQFATQKADFEFLGKKFEAEFKVLAQDILNEKARTFSEHQEKSLTDILKPLKEDINDFKTEIGSRYDAETRERISLKEQIKHITETNKLLSDQASSLTSALKGQVKMQGDWGEMILESILEHSGLTKNIHYFVQERVHDEDGRAFLPDIIVRYPDSRSVVIDSKVSLLHYTDYCSCTDIQQQDVCLQQMIRSLYAHINNLSSKEYQQKINGFDFVMLFVPMEGAYIAVMQHDTSLWRYAYSKKVLIISQTNLIPAMKLVYDLWKKEDINNNAQVIAEKAVKIYEKLAAFIEDFEKIGTQLQKTMSTFADAEKKLHSGRGNLIAQASQMKSKLKHDKPSRELPASLVDKALAEDEMPDGFDQ